MPCAHNRLPKRDPRLLLGAIVSGALLWALVGCAHKHGHPVGADYDSATGYFLCRDATGNRWPSKGECD